jgi:hypothetical protein
MSESGQPWWKIPPVGAALVAAVVGIGSCRQSFMTFTADIQYAENDPVGTFINRALVMLPFAIGALATASVYLILAEQRQKAAPRAPPQPPQPPQPPGPESDAPSPGPVETSEPVASALRVFLAITGICALGMAVISLLLGYSGDDADPESILNFLLGALLGAGLGCFISIPAAILTYVGAKGRKKS